MDVLLAAVAQARNRVSFDLAIVGDGPERTDLQRLANGLGAADRVRFVGWQENPLPSMAQADVIVIPSRYEGLPNVLLEALCLAKPTIVTRCSPIVRDLAAAGACLDVPCDNPSVLASAIASLLSDGPLRDRLGRRARKAASDFDLPVAAAQYEAAIKEAIEKNRQTRRSGPRRP